MYLSSHWDGFPLGLGLVVEDKPTELSCAYSTLLQPATLDSQPIGGHRPSDSHAASPNYNAGLNPGNGETRERSGEGAGRGAANPGPEVVEETK